MDLENNNLDYEFSEEQWESVHRRTDHFNRDVDNDFDQYMGNAASGNHQHAEDSIDPQFQQPGSQTPFTHQPQPLNPSPAGRHFMVNSQIFPQQGTQNLQRHAASSGGDPPAFRPIYQSPHSSQNIFSFGPSPPLPRPSLQPQQDHHTASYLQLFEDTDNNINIDGSTAELNSNSLLSTDYQYQQDNQLQTTSQYWLAQQQSAVHPVNAGSHYHNDRNCQSAHNYSAPQHTSWELESTMADDSYLDESRTASMGTQIDEVNNSHDGSQLYEVATTSSHNGNPPSVDNEGSEYHPHSESAVSEPDLDACHQGDGEETGEVDEADEAGGENLEVDPEEDTEKPKGKKKKTNVVVPRPPRTLKPQDPNDLICPGTITSVSDFEYKKWEAVMARKRAKFVPQFDLTTPEGQAAKAKYDELFRNRVAQIFRAVMDCDNEEIIDLPTKNAEGVSAIAKKIVNHVFDPEFVEERCARVVEAIVDYDNGIIGITEANRSLKIEKKLTFDERFELVKKALRKSKNTCKNVLKNNDYIYTLVASPSGHSKRTEVNNVLNIKRSMQVKTAVALTKLAKGEVPEVLLPRVDEMKALDEMPKGPRSNAKDPNKPKRKYKKNPKKAATETTEVDDAAPSQPRQKRKYTKRTPATQPPAEADNAEENTEQTQKPAKRTRTKKNAEPKPVEEGGVSAVAGPSRQVSRTASAEGSSRQASSTSSGRPGPSMTSPHASSEFTFRSSSDETMAINARMNNTQHVTGPPPTQVVMPRVPMFGAPGSDIVLDVRHAVRTVPHSAPRHQSDGRMSFADDYSAGNQDSMFEFGDLEEPLFGDE